MFDKTKKKANAINKELFAAERREKKLQQAAENAKPAAWKMALGDKLPEKVYNGLEGAFCKGFSVVFCRGSALIEKGYNKEDIRADYAVYDYAVQVRGRRKELKQMQRGARRSELLNLTVTTLEGIGLGALGIGMPDIVLFLGVLLKGIYETALHYGFDYESRREQVLILKMMETALSTGGDWTEKNAEVDELLMEETEKSAEITDEIFNAQLRQTSSVFALDMLLLKFIQGVPVVGIIGGAANPVYYNKVMKYVQLKYRKRYLMRQKEKLQAANNIATGFPFC